MPIRHRLRTPSPELEPPLVPPNSDSTVLNTSSPPCKQPRKRTKLVTEDMVTKTGRNRSGRKRCTPRQKAFQLARSIRQNIDLWVNIPQAINVGRVNETLEEYKSMRETDELYDKNEKEAAGKIIANSGNKKERLLGNYRSIIELLHGQRDYIESLSLDDDRDFWQEMNIHADAGRNNDAGKLRDQVHAYVLKSGQLDPPLHNKRKADRGTSHPQLMRVILPMSVIHKYGKDDKFEDMVKAKKFKMKHSNAPAFLYDTEQWDSDNMDVGLLKGHFPILVLRQILFGPKAATAEAGSRTVGTRKNNVKIAGLTKVTPELIAYACVHLDQYGEYDEDFSFKSFYYWILKFFEEADEDWVKDTIDFWNEKTFGPTEEVENDEDDGNDDKTLFANILALQRQRKARAAAQPIGFQTQKDSQYTQNAFASFG